MIRKLYTTLLLVAFCSIAATAQQTVINDANAKPRAISGSFNSIKVSGAIDVYIVQGNEEGLAVSASKDKYVDNIRTEIQDGVLEIWYGERSGFIIETNGSKKGLRVYVSCKQLQKIKASGASGIFITGVLQSDVLTINVSGASNLKGELKTGSLTLDLSGASDAKLSGTATEADLEASGASDIAAFDLVTDNCSARASGASDINVTVNKELNARAKGASDVRYKGACVLKDVHTSGASSVGKRG